MVCSVYFHLFKAGEVEEVGRAVGLVVELSGVGQLQLIVHGSCMTHTCTQRGNTGTC